ncbi:MAG: RNA polymerase sigma factor [Ardenticatenaceae bacterium]
MQPPDDRPLIQGCLDGDHQAWAALVKRYERLIYSIPLRYGFSESQAADIFQDVCLILLDKLEQLRDQGKLASWLGTVTRRECWRVIRRLDAAGPEDPIFVLNGYPSDDGDPMELVEAWEAWQAVQHAMAELEEPCRTLLERLYYSNPTPSYAEIAEEMHIPVGSIGPTRARCLKKLQRLMGGRFYRVYQE